MDWYSNGIGPAIQEAKSRDTLFVVVVVPAEAESGSSAGTFLDLLNEVSGKLTGTVAIKLIHGSDSFKQFSQLYPVILVPSVYFIDSKSGVDLEVTGGDVVTVESLSKSIEKAFTAKNNSSGSKSETVESTEKPSLDERVAKAKKLLQEKREKKEQEDKDQEKNRELERRALGKNIQEVRRKQEEEETLRVAEQRKRDKEEERLAKERVRAQIAQDRADKAAKFNQLKTEEEEKRQTVEKQRAEQEAEVRERQAAAKSSTAKIQFRLPDGGTRTYNFDAGDKLSTIYQYVSGEVMTSGPFSLRVAFPRRVLDQEPRTSSLRDVGLVPSGVVMVMPMSEVSGYSGSVMDYVWLLLTPFTILWSFIQPFLSTSVSSSSNPAPRDGRNRPGPPASQSAYTRDGNIARLRNGDDDDDENNTYNGNSTQQM